MKKMKKKRKFSNFGFRSMVFLFRFIRKKEKIIKILNEIPLKTGDIILDYGAGPGDYAIEAARMVLPNGHVFSADIHPLAEKYVQKKTESNGISNITTITTDCELYINDKSIDYVFIFDVIHHLENLQQHLNEFKRVLKPSGKLILLVEHHDAEHYVNKIENLRIFKREKATKYLFFFKSVN
ncbi:class I SAM-dependent methyltransferase [Promethearchaeum syntrophicum]|uniref:Class I SAM-dependent methyltransferase n=1 Tax=Promethearchaeum syntrophicum TaxID=2594042 RepID=A0A5B9DD06_9ARCH|nr:class I SAM-dependent methyltransferase [Candidatus Prometheoarchaeum syntrophicum]